MEILSIMDMISGKLGVVATLIVFYLIVEVRELKSRVNKLESEAAALKECLSDIRAGVAFIKGKLSKDEE